MTKIGLISDTHGWLDPNVFKHFEHCDEIWHAGDFGEGNVIQQLADFKPLRGVWGNIDTLETRSLFPEILRFSCESANIFITHIGGYPGRYSANIKPLLLAERPTLFISGHSHILKVIYDDKINTLHINPGAAGNQGWHKIRTIVRFDIDGAVIKNCEVIELGRRGQ